MTENTDASEAEKAGPAEAPRRPGRSFFRRIIYPLAVIAVIAGVIWYLERGDDGGTSSTGEKYGPDEMPAELTLPGVKIAPEEGAMAPNFLLEELKGGEVRLSDLRGQAVVINFWATWCAPCRKEMPQLVQAYEKYKSDGLVVLAVNLQEGKSIASKFADDFGMDFPVVVDRDGEVGDLYRLLGLPTTYFVDREGIVRSIFTGPFEAQGQGKDVQGAIEASELEKRIAEILGPEGTP